MLNEKYGNFERKLAFHTAPTLLGIKCGSLISLAKSEFDADRQLFEFNLRAAKKGLKIKILCDCGKKTLLLVYNEKLMRKRLEQAEVREMLLQCGYGGNHEIEDCLEHLGRRVRESGNFPHEIGIFLDYPIEDVIGFIENKGANFKLCGFWKVYGCEERAKKTFANYNKCRNFLCNKLNQGNDIYQALKIS